MITSSARMFSRSTDNPQINNKEKLRIKIIAQLPLNTKIPHLYISKYYEIRRTFEEILRNNTTQQNNIVRVRSSSCDAPTVTRRIHRTPCLISGDKSPLEPTAKHVGNTVWAAFKNVGKSIFKILESLGGFKRTVPIIRAKG